MGKARILGDNLLCLVEIKRKRRIGDEVIEEMDKKVSAIKRRKGVSVRTALVYEGQITRTIQAHGYFNALVDIREIL